MVQMGMHFCNTCQWKTYNKGRTIVWRHGRPSLRRKSARGGKAASSPHTSMWWDDQEMRSLCLGAGELQRRNDEKVSSRQGGCENPGNDSTQEFQAEGRGLKEDGAASSRIENLRLTIAAQEVCPGKSQGCGRQERPRIRRYPSEATTSLMVVAAVIAQLALSGCQGADAASWVGPCFASSVSGCAGFVGLCPRSSGAESLISRAHRPACSLAGSSLLGLGQTRDSLISQGFEGSGPKAGPLAGKGSRLPRGGILNSMQMKASPSLPVAPLVAAVTKPSSALQVAEEPKKARSPAAATLAAKTSSAPRRTASTARKAKAAEEVGTALAAAGKEGKIRSTSPTALTAAAKKNVDKVVSAYSPRKKIGVEVKVMVEPSKGNKATSSAASAGDSAKDAPAASKDAAAKPNKGQEGDSERVECSCCGKEGGKGLTGTRPNGHFFSVANVEVDLRSFLSRIEALGGGQAVTERRLWSSVSREFGIDPQAARFAATSLKRMHYLLQRHIQVVSMGRMHWKESNSPLVYEPFLDMLAERDNIPKKGGKGARAARKRAGGKKKEATEVIPSGEAIASVSESGGEGGDTGASQGSEGEQRVIEFITGELGVSGTQVSKIMKLSPQLRHLSVDNNLRPTVTFLVEEAMVPEDKVAKVVGTFPQLLGLSVESNLRPMLTYLTEDLGIGCEKIGKVLVTRPQLLAVCVENLLPKIRTLLEAGNVPEEKIGSVVTKAPHLLGLSNTHIIGMIDFLTREVGMEPARVGKMIVSSPQLLGLSIESNLRPKILFLVDDIGVPREKVGTVIGSFPNILGYNVENNMLPKLQYLADEVLHVPLRKMGRAVVTCPQLLGYSLDKRIKPRHQLLQRRGMRMSISRMLAPSDLEFRRILRTADKAKKVEERAEREAKMSFADRLKKARGGKGGKKMEPEICADGEGVPLNPQTMSGLYYWHFSNAESY